MSHTISDVQWHAFILLEKYRPHISSVKYRLSSITPPFSGNKVDKPLSPSPPPYYSSSEINKWKTVLLNYDWNSSRGLICYGLFTSCKFWFVFDIRHDLQLHLPLLNISTLHPSSLAPGFIQLR